MTDYSEGHSTRCQKCGTSFHTADGPMCDCGGKEEEVKFHVCPGCEKSFDPDIYDEIRGCFDHEEDKDRLREMCFEKDDTINLLHDLLREKNARIHQLELGVDALEKGLRKLQELSGQEAISEVGKHG